MLIEKVRLLIEVIYSQPHKICHKIYTLSLVFRIFAVAIVGV